MPPAGTSGPLSGSSAAPRPNPARAQDPGRDAHLPDWLRAMDPGAPPDLSRLHSSGPGRAGGRSPASSYQSPLSDPHSPRTSGNPGTDPFSISRLDAALPPLEGFPPSAPPSHYPGRMPAAASDPFAARSPFGQAPGNQPPRPGDSFPGMNRPSDSFPGASRNPGFPPLGTPQPGGAGASAGWQPDRRPSHPAGEAAGGFSAGSLVDKTMVPEWMREIDSGPGAFAQPAKAGPLSGPRPAEPFASQSAASAAEPAAASPFDGASLVDEKSLPDWLRSNRETEPLPLPITLSNSMNNPRVGDGPAEKKAASSAEEAGTDDDALPEWLQQVYSEANVPPLNEDKQDKPPVTLGPQKFSGSDLIDKRSVPTWIREAEMTSPLENIADILATTPPAQPQESKPADAQAAFAAANTAPAEPFSARSLVNEEELPEWMRHLSEEGAPAPKDSSALHAAAEAASQASASGFFSAAELVDTHALPVWMKGQESPAAPQAAAQPGAPSDASGSASGIFSATELIDTHALPAWIKDQEPPAAPPSAAGPSSEAAGPTGSVSGIFSAAELVDTHMLPAWMKGQEPPAAPASAGAQSDGPSGALGSASGVFSAAELVDTQALPAWLKANDTPQPPPPPPVTSGPLEGRPPSSKITPIPTGFATQTTGAFSAAELVDTKALPAWLKDGGPSTGAHPAQASQSAPVRPPEGSISATELVDTGVLPAWLRGAEGASASGPGAAKPAARGPTPPSASDQTGGFSAASLVDPEALPEWLRPAQSGALNPNVVTSRSGADWGSGNLQEPSSFSAGALIDPKELPDWMQSPEGVQRPGSGGDAGEDGPQARVPRRPRLSNEPDRAPSQAAASVFSSVLGPTAGEEPRDQTLLSASGIREVPPPDRSNPFNQLSAQAQGQGRDSGALGGWNQPAAAPGAGGDWSGNFARGMNDEPPERQRPEYRPLGPLSEAQRSRPPMQPSEEFGDNGPAQRRPSGRIGPDAGFGMPEAQGQEPFGGRGFGDYPPAQQGRGAPPRLGYQSGYDGWEGGPGFEQGYLDDEVGPPSGMFAKLKRMLGFGR